MARIIALLIGLLLAGSAATTAFRFWGSPIDLIGDGVPRTDERLGTSAVAQAKERKSRVDAEIARLGRAHPWAGNYYYGDGLGTNVSLGLAPEAGFVFDWEGCLGTYDRNWGEVDASSGMLEFRFRFPNERKDYQGLAPKMAVVPWGERHYLIPLDLLPQFCNQVNTGWEPRSSSHGMYLLRRGDEGKAVTGLPRVPEEFRKLLNDEVEARVVEVGASRQDSSRGNFIRVTIDKGEEAGVKKGMKFNLVEPDLWRVLEIDTVGHGRSEGEIFVRGTQDQLPVVGWRFSSKLKKRR